MGRPNHGNRDGLLKYISKSIINYDLTAEGFEEDVDSASESSLEWSNKIRITKEYLVQYKKSGKHRSSLTSCCII